MQFQERLKSFVLRKGRLTAHQKEALSNFKDKYLIDDSFKLDTLRTNKVIALDIGFGSGETTIHLARSSPEITVLGAEVYLSGIGTVLSKASLEGLENIKILHGDVLPFLEDRVPDEFFDLVVMLYPDPWPKRKHHKRRLIKEDFLSLIHQKLKKDSIFYFKTDWEHYYQETQKAVSKNLWQEIKRENLPAEIANFPATSFERKAQKANRLSNELILKKLSK